MSKCILCGKALDEFGGNNTWPVSAGVAVATNATSGR